MEEVEDRPLTDGKTEIDDDSSSSIDDYHHLQRRSKRPDWIKIFATHILVAVSTFVFMNIFNGRLNIMKSGEHYVYCMSFVIIPSKNQLTLYSAPITPAIEWVTDYPRIDEWDNLDFWGPPNEETDKLWDSLLPRKLPSLMKIDKISFLRPRTSPSNNAR